MRVSIHGVNDREQNCLNKEYTRLGCFSVKNVEKRRRQWREEGKTNGTSAGTRGWEIEREIERLSEAEQEWERVGVQSRATSTAVHCSAQPLLCALLTIRLHALKRPLQQQSCTAQGAACWWTATLQRAFDLAFWTADVAGGFKDVMETWCPRQNSQPAPASACSQFALPPGLCKRVTHWLYAIPAESYQPPWPGFPSLGTSASLLAFVAEVASLQTQTDTSLNLLKWEQKEGKQHEPVNSFCLYACGLTFCWWCPRCWEISNDPMNNC